MNIIQVSQLCFLNAVTFQSCQLRMAAIFFRFGVAIFREQVTSRRESYGCFYKLRFVKISFSLSLFLYELIERFEMNAKENSTAPSTKSTNALNTKLYGKIVLTLQNCLLPEEKLNSTPSHLDGLDAETETDLRILGCELIQTAGILLKLPQVGFLAPI